MSYAQLAEAMCTPDAQTAVRDILQSYKSQHGFVRHQIESFNKFVLDMLPKMVTENARIEVDSVHTHVRHIVQFGKILTPKPSNKENDGFTHDVMPDECKKRALTYSSNVMVDIEHQLWDTSSQPVLTARKMYRRVLLCRLPIMTHSALCHLQDVNKKECMYDAGGYFIIKGHEKVVLPQEKPRPNYASVKMSNKANFSHVCEVRSWNEQKIRSTSTLYIYITSQKGASLPRVSVVLPFIDFQIPLAALFRLIDVDTVDEMLYRIVGKPVATANAHFVRYIRAILDNDLSQTCMIANQAVGTIQAVSKDTLKIWIGREGKVNEATNDGRIRYMTHNINNEFLPHMGLDDSHVSKLGKSLYLGFAVRKLLLVYTGNLPPDDRDNYALKRLETAGMSLALLFRQLYRTFLRTLETRIKKEVDKGVDFNLLTLIDTTRITNRITSGIKYAMCTGNWGTQKGASTQTGVAQILTRINDDATESHLRRVNTPVNRESKCSKIRQLPPSHWGRICPVESPEGAPCGLVKSLALMCHVRTAHVSWPFLHTCMGLGMVPLSTASEASMDMDDNEEPVPMDVDDNEASMGVNEDNEVSVPVLINGTIVGHVTHADQFTADLRELRRCQELPFDTTIVFHEEPYALQRVCITTDSGACLAPVFVLANMHKFWQVFTRSSHDRLWSDMMSAGIIEYLDKEEEMTMRVAVQWKDLLNPDNTRAHFMPYTHVELHPSVILGTLAGKAPFSHHNQGPRNIYEAAMAKQSIGVFATNVLERFETVSHVLHYPQSRLVTTLAQDLTHTNQLPAGQTAVVAIMSYTGFNQDDSIIMNQSAIDRGLFNLTTYRTFKEQAKGVGADREYFEKPGEDCTGLRKANYDTIDEEDGLPSEGTKIEPGDVLIGKVLNTSAPGTECRTRNVKRDHSVVYKHREDAVVDRVVLMMGREGSPCVLVRTRSLRKPEIGNKFSSHHGQKGVIGITLRQEDMPFTPDGIVPDLMINPHAVPSRMTVGQIVETLVGKAGAVEGRTFDGTPFEPFNPDVEESDTRSILDICTDKLASLGYNRHGNEVMYSGFTGEPLRGRVFMGPVHYQCLKHMVVDKVHSRATGPNQILTRQPVEGRAREGGLRFGEMERDVLIAHGAANTLKSKLFTESDAFQTVVCSKCGLVAESARPKDTSIAGMHVRAKEAYCRNCDSTESVRETALPYAFKLLQDELGAMNIAMRLDLAPDQKVV